MNARAVIIAIILTNNLNFCGIKCLNIELIYIQKYILNYIKTTNN